VTGCPHPAQTLASPARALAGPSLEPGSDLREFVITAHPADLAAGLAWGLGVGASWQGSRPARGAV